MIPTAIIFVIAGMLTYYFRRVDAQKGYNIRAFDEFKIKKMSSTDKSYIRPFEEYTATEQEILEVEKQILENGFWEEHDEWRISTVTSSKIEPKIINNKK